MNLVGLFVGYHDSNLAAWDGERLRYRKFERLSGVKHERVPDLARFQAALDEWGVRPDALALADSNWNGLGVVPYGDLWLRQAPLPLWPGIPAWMLDHHLAHALSGSVASKLMHGDLFYSLALDGKGDHGIRARTFKVGKGLEIEPLWTSHRFAVGDFFTEVGRRLALPGDRVDMAGKVMGLQAYGLPDRDLVEEMRSFPIEWLTSELLLNRLWRNQLPVDPYFYPAIEEAMLNRDFLDWLATVHLIIGDAIVRVAQTLPADAPLLFAGGCAQNSVYNEQLIRTLPQPVVIPAHCYDGGISYGLVDFLARRYDMPLPSDAAYPFSQNDEFCGYAGEGTIGNAASLIASGKVVGWMQGHGEVGPRALGHRSILYDPTAADAKDVLNGRVKFRESWRPFAASVRLEDAPRYFDLDGSSSPWMQRALRAQQGAAETLPGVVHADGTSRTQTVEQRPELDSYRALIAAVGERNGHPAVLNTSLNTGGEPIYGNRVQCLALLESGRLDALVVGDTLYVGGPR